MTTASEHELTIHAHQGERYWLTCTCGWHSDDLPNNWDVWQRICGEHIEASSPALSVSTVKNVRMPR